MKKFFTYINRSQEEDLRVVRELHKEKIEALHEIDLGKIIQQLTTALRSKDELVMNSTQINRDVLLGSLRRIEMSYKEFKKTSNEAKYHDERENIALVFFHNAKAFIEVAKKQFPNIMGKTENIHFCKTITVLRNYFAHSYEKDFLDQKVVVRTNINFFMDEDGLFELLVFDFDTSEEITSVLFSLEVLYSEIVELTNAITKFLTD